MRRTLMTAALLVSMASSAFADQVRTFTVRQEDGSYCEEDLVAEMKHAKGVKKYRFDRAKLQVVATLRDGVSDQVVLDAIRRARARCAMEMGHDASPASYAKDADVVTLSKRGEAIGPLKRHLVPGKYTVFDIYADWCGPCQLVDRKLREITATRRDVAVRKVNVVDFNTPVVRELGPKMKALPYVVVFDPKGKRTDIIGGDRERLASALGAK